MKRALLAVLILASCRRESPTTEQPIPVATTTQAAQPNITPKRVAATLSEPANPAPKARRIQGLAELPPAPSSKRRAVAPPAAPTVPSTVTIGGFPVADNGKTFRVKCDGVESQCVVTNGNCVALLKLVSGVPHSCSWGHDLAGKGGVAFLSGTITIE